MSIRVTDRHGARHYYPRGDWYNDETDSGNLDIHHGHDYDGDEADDESTMLATFAAGTWEIVEFHFPEDDAS